VDKYVASMPIYMILIKNFPGGNPEVCRFLSQFFVFEFSCIHVALTLLLSACLETNLRKIAFVFVAHMCSPF
jgi:hypothetical protein